MQLGTKTDLKDIAMMELMVEQVALGQKPITALTALL
jgi:hypothetical protein